MSTTIESLLTRNLHEVFGEPDPAKRAVAIQALYAPDSVFSDPHGHHVGHRALEEAVAALQAKTQGHVFTVLSGPDALRDSGRLAWAFGPPEDPRQVTGLDVIVVEDGRIAALYTFLDASRVEG